MPNPRKPIKLHIADGTYRPARHGKDHPTYAVEAPEAPGWLIAPAKDLWPGLVAVLVESGVMGAAFAPALAMLCNSLARMVELQQRVSDEGAVIEVDGRPKRNPSLVALEHAEAQSLRMLREFGLTPASLGAVATNPQEPDNDKSRFFAK